MAILAAKFLLAARINVNWDEFFFLSHVYALERGELALLLQGAYAHAFLWITGTGGDEVDQVVRLRLVMCALLVVSGAILYALARLWTSRPAALVAVLAFLSTWPVLSHGASFRADALILPLTLAAFYFTLRGTRLSWRSASIAGCCIGLAFVVTVKSVMLLPALFVAALLPDPARQGNALTGTAEAVRKLALISCIAAVLAAALLALHSTAVVAAAEPAGAFASRAITATVLDMPFAPRGDYLIWLMARGTRLLDRRARRARHCSASAGMVGRGPVVRVVADPFLPERLSVLLPDHDGTGGGIGRDRGRQAVALQFSARSRSCARRACFRHRCAHGRSI